MSGLPIIITLWVIIALLSALMGWVMYKYSFTLKPNKMYLIGDVHCVFISTKNSKSFIGNGKEIKIKEM